MKNSEIKTVPVGVGMIDTTGKTFEEIKKEICTRAMLIHRGNMRKASQAIGVSHSTFFDWVYKFKANVVRYNLKSKTETPSPELHK